MRKHDDFSKGVRTPYARKLKQPVTIRQDSQTVEYFKALAERKGIPYQSLINLYLRDCAERRIELAMAWKASRQGQPNASLMPARAWGRHGPRSSSSHAVRFV